MFFFVHAGWSGIRCEEAVVLGIDLSCTLLPLNLPFPRTIGQFNELKYLNLSRCALTGPIPWGSIWSLEKLESLDMSGNRF